MFTICRSRTNMANWWGLFPRQTSWSLQNNWQNNLHLCFHCRKRDFFYNFIRTQLEVEPMTHPEIIHDETPIRLFKSDFLEFFTHISPVTVMVIWLPIAIYFTWSADCSTCKDKADGSSRSGYLIGLFLWTISEYLLHRFLFHFKPRTPRQERLSFLFHGVHHAQPQEKSRLVMPIALSIPLAALFYFAFVVDRRKTVCQSGLGGAVVHRIFWSATWSMT